MNSETLKKQVSDLKQKYIDTSKLQDNTTTQLKKARTQLKTILRTQEIGQEAAEQIQQQVHRHISNIVNKCLQAIFDDPYEFKIRFVPKRGKTEAELLFIRDGRERKNVGGGVIDVVAFALRLSSLLLSNKEIAPVEILDQPFGNVSEEDGNLERVPDMLIMLAEEFGIQFIQVTHEEKLKMGKIIKIK